MSDMSSCRLIKVSMLSFEVQRDVQPLPWFSQSSLRWEDGPGLSSMSGMYEKPDEPRWTWWRMINNDISNEKKLCSEWSGPCWASQWQSKAEGCSRHFHCIFPHQFLSIPSELALQVAVFRNFRAHRRQDAEAQPLDLITTRWRFVLWGQPTNQAASPAPKMSHFHSFPACFARTKWSWWGSQRCQAVLWRS